MTFTRSHPGVGDQSAIVFDIDSSYIAQQRVKWTKRNVALDVDVCPIRGQLSIDFEQFEQTLENLMKVRWNKVRLDSYVTWLMGVV